MNNAEYIRLMKKQRELAKLKEAEITEALKLDTDNKEETPEELPEDTQEGTDNGTESDGENGDNAPSDGTEG